MAAAALAGVPGRWGIRARVGHSQTDPVCPSPRHSSPTYSQPAGWRGGVIHEETVSR
jgi:hypothetical protein